MLSTKSEAALTLSLNPSRLFLSGLGACHLLALISVAVCDLAVAVSVVLVAAILVSLIWNGLRYGHSRSRWFIRRVVWSADGQWMLSNGVGEERAVQLLGGYVHPQLLILRFAWNRFGRRAVVVPPDAADSEAIRRFRVRLRVLKQDEGGLLGGRLSPIIEPEKHYS